MSSTPFSSARTLPLPPRSSPPGVPPVWLVAPRAPASATPPPPAGWKPAVQAPAPAGWETGGTPTASASAAPACSAGVLAGGGWGSGTGASAPLRATLSGREAAPTGWKPAVHVPSDSLSTSGEGRGEVEALLAEIEPEARPWLRRSFAQTLEAVEADLARPPAQRRLTPQPYLVQHLGRPRFQTEEPLQQDQPGLDRLLRQALWRAVDALEAGALLAASDVYQPLLAEQCAQLGRVYREIRRRAGAWVALSILHGELRLLHHRGSAAVEHLLFA